MYTILDENWFAALFNSNHAPFCICYLLKEQKWDYSHLHVLSEARMAGHLGVHTAFEFGHGSWGLCCLCLADCDLQDPAVTYFLFSLWFGFSCVVLLLWLVYLGIVFKLMLPHLVSTLCSCRPTYSVLGHVPGTELYVDMETHRGVRVVPVVPSRFATVPPYIYILLPGWMSWTHPMILNRVCQRSQSCK